VRVAGKTHCQGHSLPALGYFRARRKLDPAAAALPVAPVLVPRAQQVPEEAGLDRGRKHRDAVLVALAGPDNDLVGCEVDVLPAQAAALDSVRAGQMGGQLVVLALTLLERDERDTLLRHKRVDRGSSCELGSRRSRGKRLLADAERDLGPCERASADDSRVLRPGGAFPPRLGRAG